MSLSFCSRYLESTYLMEWSNIFSKKCANLFWFRFSRIIFLAEWVVDSGKGLGIGTVRITGHHTCIIFSWLFSWFSNHPFFLLNTPPPLHASLSLSLSLSFSLLLSFFLSFSPPLSLTTVTLTLSTGNRACAPVSSLVDVRGFLKRNREFVLDTGSLIASTEEKRDDDFLKEHVSDI